MNDALVSACRSTSGSGQNKFALRAPEPTPGISVCLLETRHSEYLLVYRMQRPFHRAVASTCSGTGPVKRSLPGDSHSTWPSLADRITILNRCRVYLHLYDHVVNGCPSDHKKVKTTSVKICGLLNRFTSVTTVQATLQLDSSIQRSTTRSTAGV